MAIQNNSPGQGRGIASLLAAAVFLTRTWQPAWAQPALTALLPQTNGWMQVQGGAATNRVFVLETSTNLAHWSTLALLDPRLRNPKTGELVATNQSFAFMDTAAPELTARFYRFYTSALRDTNDWKNQVFFPHDAFASQADHEPAIRWLKFSILCQEPHRVHYQDSDKYVLHYDFASARLDAFRGISRAEFDRVSLFTTNQQVLLGTVLFAPEAAEYGIQLAGQDPFPPQLVRRVFEQVRTTIVAPPNTTPFYFPSYEQAQAAALDQAFFAGHGIRISSVLRWLRGDQVYAAGWVLGRVRIIAAPDIQAAYLAGRLLPHDILVTDGVPAEVPFVSGILTLTPATPSSHAAILAGAYGVPFAYVADPALQAQLRQWDAQEVVLQCWTQDGFARVQVTPAQDALDPALRTELLALKDMPATRIVPKARFGQFSASVESLTPDDIRYFGGKAANFGLLRRVIPSQSPRALAFSFDLWDAFMDQTVPSGVSLRSEISRRLSRFRYPPDMPSLTAELRYLRDIIKKDARFDQAQRTEIARALAAFDPDENIRFRSSSNAEDAETFTAAGLYDSYSGCLADDLDGDESGPCLCDPVEPQERGVFRAIQKVYASFYNDNAFLERLRRGIDESQVAMGLLVHKSSPDEFELANGVATVSRDASSFGPPERRALLVTQAGAVSVANPEGNARPETVEATEFAVTLREPSSLLPLGSHVLQWPSEYETLRQLLFNVYDAYRPPTGAVSAADGPLLDFEYKKVAPGALLVKQVRPLPRARVHTNQYLLREPVTYWVYQSESSDVLANHRLKCWLSLRNRSVRLDPGSLSECLYTEARFQFRTGTHLETLSGPLRSWPDFAHSFTNDPRRGWLTSDAWTAGRGPEERRFEIISVIPEGARSLFVPQAEIRKWLAVRYATPVPMLASSEGRNATSGEQVQLIAAPEPGTLQPGEPDIFSATNGWRFEVSFLTSTNASGPPLGIDKNFWGTYPAALSPWMHTRITGLTSTPIELRGYWSQSARAGHKHRYAWHVFEPAMEEGLPATQLAELRGANIQLIHIERETWPGGEVTVSLLGWDGQFRRL